MSLIILEGCDACFKTTVANKLSYKLGFPVVKGSSFEMSQCSNEELFNHFKEMTKSENVIIDRFIYSNLVYASLYDDYAILSQEQKEVIESLMKHKAVLVYLYASENVIHERLDSRGDDYVENKMIGKIIDKYAEVITPTLAANELPYLLFNTARVSSDDIVENIMGYLKQTV